MNKAIVILNRAGAVIYRAEATKEDDGAAFIIPGADGHVVGPDRAPPRTTMATVVEQLARSGRLRGAVLDGLDLSRTNLADGDLRGCSAVGTDFSNALMTGCRLDDAQMDDCSLQEAVLDRASMVRTSLRGSNMIAVRATHVDATEAVMDNANAYGSNWSNSRLRGVRATNLRLDRALVCAVSAEGADISGSAIDADFGPAIMGSSAPGMLPGVRPGPGGVWDGAKLDLDARRSSWANCSMRAVTLAGDWTDSSFGGARITGDVSHAKGTNLWDCAAA